MGVWWMARTLPLPSSSPSLVRISAAVSASRKPKRSSSAAEVKPAVCVAVAAAAPPVAPPVRVVWPPVWAEGVCVAVWKLRLVMAGGGALDGRRGPRDAGVSAPRAPAVYECGGAQRLEPGSEQEKVAGAPLRAVGGSSVASAGNRRRTSTSYQVVTPVAAPRNGSTVLAAAVRASLELVTN